MKIADAHRGKASWRESGALPAPRNVRESLTEAIICLEAAAVSSAPLAAELLLMRVLDCERAWLYAHPEQILTVDQQAAFDRLIEQRAAGVPTQHLTGHQEFWSLDFEVNASVLIPRPETEHLIEVALARLGPRRTEPLRIADIGTGSGCIAVALARELPNAHIIATDISAKALAVARRNAARHGLGNRIEFLQSNLLDGARAEAETGASAGRKRANGPGEGRCDLIASNPPYVALRDAHKLAREVRDHEPHEALFAGKDGLAFYSPLFALATRTLAPGGLLVVELGFDCASPVRRLLENPVWRNLAIERDLAGIERVISAERAA